MLTRNDAADIVSDTSPSDLVVCGFFTPDYRPLAAMLADSLAPLHPFHFFAASKDDDTWTRIVHRKPRIVLKAMETYPDSTVILLDVDSTVRGSIRDMAEVPGDVSAFIKVRPTKRLLSSRIQTFAQVSARSMVFKPNDRARRFLRDWDDEISTGAYRGEGCERALLVTLFRASYMAFSSMDRRYSGRESTAATDDDVIVHDSASRGKSHA